MSKLLMAGMLGYWMGMKHKWLCKHMCLRNLHRHAKRAMRLI